MREDNNAKKSGEKSVTILTPALNEGSHLPETYESLVRQTSNSWHWLVADNCSDDSTVDFLAGISSDSRVSWIRHEKRLSAEENWQSLIDLAKTLDSEYVMFLSGDDWLPDPEVLQDVLEGLASNPGGSLIGRIVAKSSPDAVFQREMFSPRPISDMTRWGVFKLFLSDWSWSHLIYACYKREFFFETFNPKSLRLTRDSDWLISLGSAVRDQELTVLRRTTLMRRVGDPQSADYHSRQRGKIPRVKSRRLAQLLVFARKLVWPIFVYLPNGMRFFPPNVRHLFVVAMIALWFKNVKRVAMLPLEIIARLFSAKQK